MSEETDIAGLEARLVAALDRIRSAAEKLAQPAVAEAGGDDGAAEAVAAAEARIAELEAKLAEGASSNAELEARVEELKKRQDGHIKRLEAKLEGYREANGALDAELQRMHAANAELSRVVAELTEAAVADAPEPHLINRAMKAELEALRVAREAETAEVATVLGDLRAALEEEA